MKTIAYLAAFLTATSCIAPYSFYYEKSAPSVSGMDVNNEDVVVAFLYPENEKDSTVCANVAMGFAQNLNDNLGRPVEVSSMKVADSVEFNPHTEARSFILNSDKDAIFIIDNFGGKIYGYDSMTQIDSVYTWSIPSVCTNAQDGKELSKKFVPQWKTSSINLYYAETAGTDWGTPISLCYKFRFDDAIGKWIDILKVTKNKSLRGALQYNIAAACYMQQRYDLALEWLNLSDKTWKGQLNDSLRVKLSRSLQVEGFRKD